ncbi:unnamed protein product [Protopolystoma xenopodis]|uniref:Uncharacterized protein n=1 Tax=Protopolystoma xenopodis TaxID=117903 RepID=A0A448XNB7_9PLAT|nr:unnamed protein product [Protopolystoma xenopodis]
MKEEAVYLVARGKRLETVVVVRVPDRRTRPSGTGQAHWRGDTGDGTWAKADVSLATPPRSTHTHTHTRTYTLSHNDGEKRTVAPNIRHSHMPQSTQELVTCEAGLGFTSNNIRIPDPFIIDPFKSTSTNGTFHESMGRTQSGNLIKFNTCVCVCVCVKLWP